jgi:hypothetical protein
MLFVKGKFVCTANDFEQKLKENEISSVLDLAGIPHTIKKSTNTEDKSRGI